MNSTDVVPSRYLVFGTQIHPHPSGRQVRAVYHTATATALLLDTATADVLRGLAPLTTLDARSRDSLATLGLLVPAGSDEAATVIAHGQQAASTSRERQFVIMPTAYCNMGCDYCGQEHRRGATPDPARHRDNLSARVERAMAGGRYDRVTVRWFGGEPLLGFATLRSLSRRFIADAERHQVGYAAVVVTNGVLLDLRKLRALHLECRVRQIEVTLDGTAEVHEASRPLKNGGRTFDRIVANLRSALSDPDLAGLRLTVRTNIGTHNADQAVPFAAAMRDAGLADPRLTFYPAPIHTWGNDVSGFALSGPDAARVELAWYSAYLEAGLTCKLLPTSTRPVVCTATSRHSEVIAPDGRIYSCTEQPLVPGFTDAHVATAGELAADQLRPDGAFDDWYDTLSTGETGCGDCRLLPVCGGGCPKLWREGTPACPPLKANLPQRLDLFAIATTRPDE